MIEVFLMALSGFQLISINATVIVGLLILLTFSIIGTTTLGEDALDLRKRSQDTFYELLTVQTIFEKRCEYDSRSSLNVYESGTECHELQKQMDYWSAKRVILGEKAKNIDEDGIYYKFRDPLTFLVLVGEIASNFLIIPFALSAILESKKSTRREGLDNPASRFGLVTMEIGFIFLTIILTFNAILGSYVQIIG